jgi:ABC-type uncharacterized transport system substrate-binding protein
MLPENAWNYSRKPRQESVGSQSFPSGHIRAKKTRSARLRWRRGGLKTELQYLPLTTLTEIDSAFEAIVKNRADAMLTFPDAVTLSYRSQLAYFASKRNLPSMFGWKQYAVAGSLISYGPNLDESFRRLAVFVDKILKGTKPADFPIEQPTKFELIINLKAADRLNHTPECLSQSRQGNSMTEQSRIQNLS